MNKITIGAMIGIFLTGAANGESIYAREVRQYQRVREGIRSGELTGREAAVLQRREAKLHRQIRRDHLDGNGLSPAERQKIDRKQDRLSRQIYRQKHDNQVR
jgi:hypothetical protein